MIADPNNADRDSSEPAFSSPIQLSILLVNYNGSAYLQACLESIHRYAPKGTQVILEDNASVDGSAEIAKREYPWLEVIESKENLGFSAGNNLAASHASGTFLLLLNTDTVLLEPIEPAIHWLATHDDVGALTIDMKDVAGVSQACTGRFPSVARLVPRQRMLIAPEQFGKGEFYETDWLQGSFILTRRKLWQQLNGMDEHYFMYMEDVDLCRRVRDADWKCGIYPRISYIHLGGFSFRRFPEWVTGLRIYIKHHMKLPERLIIWNAMFLGCLARVLFYQGRSILAPIEHNKVMAKACRQGLKRLVAKVR